MPYIASKVEPTPVYMGWCQEDQTKTEKSLDNYRTRGVRISDMHKPRFLGFCRALDRKVKIVMTSVCVFMFSPVCRIWFRDYVLVSPCVAIRSQILISVH